MTSTEERLRTLVAEHLDVGRGVDFGAKLAEAGVSSVDTVAFLKVITQEFKVTIPPEDFPQLQTLSDLVGYLDARAG